MAALAALQPALDALGGPIHSMSLSASHHVSEQIAERNAAVRQHNQVALLLTLFLSLLVLAFGLMAMRQMRLLGERQRALVDLTAHLREAQRQAEAASEAKSVFLANMSHEIRTPFHGLLGMLSLLRDTGLNARQVDYLRTATESADHLLTILNDVLDMSLLESGRLTLTEEPVDLRDLLREVEALMRPQAQLKSLALHIDADPGVPEKVRADRTRVKQILFNLVNNAVKFSRPRRGRARPAPRQRRRTAASCSSSSSPTPASAWTRPRWTGCSSASRRATNRARGATAAPAWAWRSRAAWRG